MNTQLTRLTELQTQIAAAADMDRLSYEPEFTRLVAELDASHEPVPTSIRNLAEELMSEAIEARFDNMPV